MCTSKACTITQSGVPQNRSLLNRVTTTASLCCLPWISSQPRIKTKRLQPGFNTIGHSTEWPTRLETSTHGYSLCDPSKSSKVLAKLYLSKLGTSTIPQREVCTGESGATITRIGLRSSAQSRELNQYSLFEEGVQQEITSHIQSISHSQSYAQACSSQLASPPSLQPVPLGDAEVIANRQQHPAEGKQQVSKEINKHQLQQSEVNESDESIHADSIETQVAKIHPSQILFTSYSVWKKMYDSIHF